MRAISLLLVASLIAVPAVAGAQAVTGLGQSWPNAQDVSSSPNYHVYVFERGNTRYIQINDANGNVRGAFARTPYSLVGLPIGNAELSTPDEPMPAPASTAGETVYQGNGVKVFVAPQPNGTTRMMAAPGGWCAEHPVECSGSFR